MRKPRGPYQGTDERRRAILDAALACFSEVGFLETTMEDIRRRSGASHGSIYHHFGSKEQIAAAAYVQCIRDYQAGLTGVLTDRIGAREGIRALVRHHLGWVQDHADYARFLNRMRYAELMQSAEASIAEDNRAFVGALSAFFKRHVAAGTLRKQSPELYVSLLLGPAQELARHWLLAGKDFDVDRISSELAEAIWRALRQDLVQKKKEVRRGQK